MLKSKDEYGLVLGGGGMKGTYQIGVWKALQELKLNVTAIAGTSIGAINGALILQNDIKKIEDLYKNLELQDILKLDSQMDGNKDIFDMKNIFKLIKEYIKQNGIDNKNLKETLTRYIDIEKVYKSKINFGLVTYSVNDSEELELFKKDIPKEKFIDYLLASSCFPIFKAQEIEDDKFLDGGFGDNIPINMLIQEGYKNIIAVDVDIVGVKKKVLDKNAQVKLISPTEDVGGWFEFNKETIEKNITLGYLDTLKAFNELQGYIYSFREPEYIKLLKQFNIKTVIGLEKVAEIYEIDKYKIYTAKEFLEVIAKVQEEKDEKYKSIMADVDLDKISSKYKDLKEMVSSGFGICLFNDIIKQKPTAKNNKILQKAFPEYLIITEAVTELMNKKGVI